MQYSEKSFFDIEVMRDAISYITSLLQSYHCDRKTDIIPLVPDNLLHRPDTVTVKEPSDKKASWAVVA